MAFGERVFIHKKCGTVAIENKDAKSDCYYYCPKCKRGCSIVEKTKEAVNEKNSKD